MEPTPQQAITPITKEEFVQRYWFSTLQMVTVINPKNYEFPFMVEGRHFVIAASSKERFPGIIANVYLDQMARIMAQDKDELGFLADPTLKKLYYDQLIVNVESLVNEASSVPSYLRNVPTSAIRQAPVERAPWDAALGERASDIAPTAPPIAPPQPYSPPPQPTPTPVVAEETSKDFELDGRKYKIVTRKDGRKMHYIDGKLSDSASYNKAASML